MTIARDSEAGEPVASARTVANLVYALHSFAIIVGLLGSASVVGSFVGSIPSIVAVILNYVKRGEAAGTWLASHFRWQIRTFWFAVLWLVVAGALFLTVIGIPIAIFGLLVLTLWQIGRAHV